MIFQEYIDRFGLGLKVMEMQEDQLKTITGGEWASLADDGQIIK
ncbi:MAG: hypothetical protein ACYDEQ_15260 [Desulfocucumaceae bacterium]